MRAWLSVLLSFCILVNSTVPAFAGPVSPRSVGQVIKVAEKAGQSSPAVARTVNEITRGTAIGAAQTDHLLMQAENLTTRLQTSSLAQQITAGNGHAPVTLRHASLNLQQTPVAELKASPKKVAKLRNEVVSLGVVGEVPAQQLDEAVQFYRTDLPKNTPAFQAVRGQNVQTIISEATPQAKECRAALSDAAALGLLGNASDAEALTQFYQAAAGGPFEYVATLITGRSLLRLQAYDAFNAWAAPLEKSGQFWEDLSAYAKKENLPVQIEVQPGGLKITVPEEMVAWLREGSDVNALSVDGSQAFTEQWIKLGRTSAPSELASAPRQTITASTAVAPVEETLVEEIAPSLEETVAPVLQNAMQGIELAPEQLLAVKQPLLPEMAASSAQGSVISAAAESSRSVSPAVTFSSNGGAVASAPVAGGASAPSAGEKSLLVPVKQRGKVVARLASKRQQAAHVSDGSFSVREWFRKSVGSLTHFYQTQAFVKGANGVETALPVHLSVDKSILGKAIRKGYNRVAFEPFMGGHIVQAVHPNGATQNFKNFHIRLPANQAGPLLRLAQQHMPEGGILKIKIEKRPNVNEDKAVLPIYDMEGNLFPVEVEAPRKIYEPNSRIVLLTDDTLGILREGEKTPSRLSGYYVRLPKNQLSSFIRIAQHSEKPFDLALLPTSNRARLVMRDASLSNASFGKTFGPVVNGTLDVSVASATGLMFIVNYVFPGFASLLTPMLKKYGEKKLLVVSMVMSTASGLLAAASGFYGFVNHMTLSPIQKILFVGALFLGSGAGILKQIVSNMLIRANRGEVIMENIKQSETAAAAAAGAVAAVEPQGWALLGKRAKEFFVGKNNAYLRDVILYNLSFVYKNVGTLAFLAAPYAINYGIELFTGVNLGLDFSISFPLYAAYCGVTTWRIARSKLRDAYSVSTLTQSQQQLQKNIEKVTAQLAAAQSGEISSGMINGLAGLLKGSLDDVALATVKLDPAKKQTVEYQLLRQQSLAGLQQSLENSGLQAKQAGLLVSRIHDSLHLQENLFGNLWHTMKMPGVAALITGMAFATTHEIVISSSFSATMRQLIDQGEWANFLVALSLYVPLIFGRLGGNVISRRLSPGSMYLFSSALSAFGTAIMATAGLSVAQTITGAAIASLGTGNFFTQMYDFIMRKYPQHNRELSSVITLSLAVSGMLAIPAGYLAGLGGFTPDLLYAGAMLLGSLVLTPAMMADSSFVKVFKYEWNQLKAFFQRMFRRGPTNPPAADLENAAPAQ